jgi:hypothetical protein
MKFHHLIMRLQLILFEYFEQVAHNLPFFFRIYSNVFISITRHIEYLSVNLFEYLKVRNLI